MKSDNETKFSFRGSSVAAGMSLFMLVAVSGCIAPVEEVNAGYTVTRPLPIITPTFGNITLPELPAASTPVGDGSAIRLSALSSGDILAAKPSGELVCVFAEHNMTLLYAAGNASSKERASGIVRIGDYVESVSAPGGFDGILRGAIFAGRGKTIIIATTSNQPIGGSEAPGHPAMLTFQRADGASSVINGTWTCGP